MFERMLHTSTVLRPKQNNLNPSKGLLFVEKKKKKLAVNLTQQSVMLGAVGS